MSTHASSKRKTTLELRKAVVRKKQKIIRQLEAIKSENAEANNGHATHINNSNDSKDEMETPSETLAEMSSHDASSGGGGGDDAQNDNVLASVRAESRSAHALDSVSRRVINLEARYYGTLARLKKLRAKNHTDALDAHVELYGGELRAEERRSCSVWNAMMREMQWMANDFYAERRWKRAASLQVSCAVSRKNVKMRQVEEEAMRLRRAVAKRTAACVEAFWRKCKTDARRSIGRLCAIRLDRGHALTTTKQPPRRLRVETKLVGIRQEGLVASLVTSKVTKGHSLVRSLARLHMISHHPSLLKTEEREKLSWFGRRRGGEQRRLMRSTFVQRESIRFTFPRVALLSLWQGLSDPEDVLPYVGMKFLGLHFTHFELNEWGVDSAVLGESLLIRSYATRAFTAHSKSIMKSPFGYFNAGSIIPFVVSCATKPQTLYVPPRKSGKRWRTGHIEYVNWLRCSNITLSVGRLVRNVVGGLSSGERIRKVLRSLRDASNVPNRYATALRLSSDFFPLHIFVERAKAAPPRVYSPRVPQHVMDTAVCGDAETRSSLVKAGRKCLTSRSPFLNLSRRIDTFVRASPKFVKVIRIVRWHMDRGGKCVVASSNPQLLEIMRAALDATRIGFVRVSETQSASKNWYALRAFSKNRNATSVMLASSHFEPSSASQASISATGFVDLDGDGDDTPLSRSLQSSSQGGLVIYSMCSALDGSNSNDDPGDTTSSSFAVDSTSQNSRERVWDDATVSAACQCVRGISNAKKKGHSTAPLITVEAVEKACADLSNAGKGSNATAQELLQIARRLAPALVSESLRAENDDVTSEKSPRFDGDLTSEIAAYACRYLENDVWGLDSRSAVRVGNEQSAKNKSTQYHVAKSAFRTQLSYAISRPLKKTVLFDGEDVSLIADDTARLTSGNLDRTDLKNQMRAAARREIFKRVEESRALRAAKIPYRSKAIAKWVRRHRKRVQRRQEMERFELPSFVGDADFRLYRPPHPSDAHYSIRARTRMHDLRKHQYSRSTGDRAVMLSYHFSPKEAGIDENLFDNIARAIRRNDPDVLDNPDEVVSTDEDEDENGTTEDQDSRKKQKEPKRSYEGEPKIVRVNRTSLPWYDSRPRAPPVVSWTDSEDAALIESVRRFGFNWSLAVASVRRIGSHTRHQRRERDCFLRYTLLRKLSKENDEKDFLFSTRRGEEKSVDAPTLFDVFRCITSASTSRGKIADPILERYADSPLAITPPHTSHEHAVRENGFSREKEASAVVAPETSPSKKKKDDTNLCPSQILDIRNKRKRKKELRVKGKSKNGESATKKRKIDASQSASSSSLSASKKMGTIAAKPNAKSIASQGPKPKTLPSASSSNSGAAPTPVPIADAGTAKGDEKKSNGEVDAKHDSNSSENADRNESTSA